jgi:hypothetical protein
MIQLLRTRGMRHPIITLESQAGAAECLAGGHGGKTDFVFEQFDRALPDCEYQRSSRQTTKL